MSYTLDVTSKINDNT